MTEGALNKWTYLLTYLFTYLLDVNRLWQRDPVWYSWPPAGPSMQRCAFSVTRGSMTMPHKLIRDLHWLRVPEKIHFPMAVLTVCYLPSEHDIAVPRPRSALDWRSDDHVAVLANY